MRRPAVDAEMGTGTSRQPRQRQVLPRDREAVLLAMEETAERFGLQAEAGGVSCCGAGREGFRLAWIKGG